MAQTATGAAYGAYPGAAVYGAAAYAAAAGAATRTWSYTLAQAYAALWLEPGAPEAVVKAAYRALAQTYHPDAGGSAEMMSRINAAYATIRAARP